MFTRQNALVAFAGAAAAIAAYHVLSATDVPKPTSLSDEARARKRFEDAGQGHVFKFFESLNADEQAALLKDLDAINVDYINKAYASIAVDEEQRKTEVIEPFKGEVAVLANASEAQAQVWRAKGMELIGAGKVGVLLMAGGQGTRLGSSEPKGMYDIGLPSGKSLFQLQAEKIKKLILLTGAKRLPWYLLTSPATHEPTVAFFKKQNYFGLAPEDVVIFQQGVNPCLSPEGKILLETRSRTARAPDGNGGLHKAIKDSGAIVHMRAAGVEHLHAFGVDNALVKVADPSFLGFCALSGAEAGNKVVLKEQPHEKVGVMCVRGGVTGVVEYSEITQAMAESRGEDGRLLYGAGNIAEHYFRTDFVEHVTSTAFLPQHVAKKAIPCVDEQGMATQPSSPNGIKLETFVFDVFALAKKVVCFAVSREQEFSPVKNKNGPEGERVQASPDSARADLSRYAISMIEKAGGVVVCPEGATFEVSPLRTYDGEGLDVKGQTFTAPFLLQ